MTRIPLPSWRFVQVWRRHFLVWRKTSIASLVGILGEPLLYLLGMGYGLGRFVGEVAGMAYLPFVATGILAASAMNPATFEAFYGGFTRMTRQNTFHAQLATPLTVADIVAGEVAWAATKSLMSGGAVFLVAGVLGAFPLQPVVLLVLPLIFLAGLAFAAMAMVVTAISPSYEFFQFYITLIVTPMYLFCGVFFPVIVLPEPLMSVVNGLPLAHVVALVRPLAMGLPLEGAGLHLLALLGYVGVCFVGAALLVRRRIIV